ncbi:multidrug ABC transporter ATP-binding protein [bacterium]|jgi:ABC-2 type transport system ATP-binding protein|nr:MAG: multidrug ABC transporter ATP-binding protein [bacterium]|tara:strand:- start:964 stop:1908 length:945 start_codon:yes stop_codon:yes gene_type:complete
MISVSNLSKNYGNVKAVDSISFDLKDGEVVGFLGANGAGKTTTLKMITGYLVPTNGEIKVNGLDIVDNTSEIQEMIGYLPELNPLYTEMRVYDYLEFLGSIRNIKGSDFKQALSRVVDKCGLSGVVHKVIADCSKGYKQRIGLAAAMIHDPKILILDEPVTGLDPNQIVEIRSLIKSLGKEKLVFMSSHILQEIQATVDKIIIIDKGKIVANGTNEELMSDFMGNVSLEMEVMKATKKSAQELQAKIPSVKFISMEKSGGVQKVNFEYPKDKDPREDIFKYAVKSKWVILKMMPQTTNLEDIFRNLTSSGASNE